MKVRAVMMKVSYPSQEQAELSESRSAMTVYRREREWSDERYIGTAPAQVGVSAK